MQLQSVLLEYNYAYTHTLHRLNNCKDLLLEPVLQFVYVCCISQQLELGPFFTLEGNSALKGWSCAIHHFSIYCAGEDVYSQIYGSAIDVSVRLDRSSIALESAYIGLSTQRSEHKNSSFPQSLTLFRSLTTLTNPLLCY